MNLMWMMACIIFSWALLQKTKTRHHISNHSLTSIRMGIMIGLALTLFDIQLAYNTIVTKTKRIVSLDTVSSFVNQHTFHTLFMVFLSNIILLISKTQIFENNSEIPVWSHMIGAFVGFFVGYHFMIYHHQRILNGQ